MGQMADLNLAACREENVRLRGIVVQQQRAMEAMRERDRVGAMEIAFIAAALQTQAVSIGRQVDRSERIDECISIGRETARKYVEQMISEAEKPSDDGDFQQRGESDDG